ncbi:unnamed protein product [Pylaiella littoralis]
MRFHRRFPCTFYVLSSVERWRSGKQKSATGVDPLASSCLPTTTSQATPNFASVQRTTRLEPGRRDFLFDRSSFTSARGGRSTDQLAQAGGTRNMAEDERSTVVVGSAPPLEDIISGAYTQRPFDLASFYAYAENKIFTENLDFLREVDTLRLEPDPRGYKSRLLKIMAEFVDVNSDSEVNLSHKIRTETQNRVAAVLEALDKDASMEPPDRGCLDDAHEAIVKLVKDDQYARYKDFIAVRRHLRVARLDALWWTQDGLTLKRFFSFPSPINSAESRLHACLASALIPVAVYLSWVGVPWLWVFIAYGYLARILCGPRLDPQAFFVLFILRPLMVDKLAIFEDHFTSGHPKRFAQSIGFVLAAVCTVLAFLELRVVMGIVALCLFGASALAAVFDVCLGCIIFMIAVEADLVPASICDDCKIRYIKGGGQGMASRSQTPSHKSPTQDVERCQKQVCFRGASPASRSGSGNADSNGNRSSQPPLATQSATPPTPAVHSSDALMMAAL